MNYLLIILTAFTLVACQSPSSTGKSESTLGEGEVAASGGLAGIYSGTTTSDPSATGGFYNEDGPSYNPGSASGYNPATNGDYYSNPAYGQNVVGGPRAIAKDRVIYFGYDSSNIDKRAEAIVTAHATYLRSHPNTRILLEGHTDSRGSREYNIALGERRAISVLKRFKALGVPVKQIRIISYGEENPAVTGYSEDAYRRNRRAVIQY